MEHYCVYTTDFEHTPGLFKFFTDNSITFEAHINRTRFWLDPQSQQHQRLFLRYADYIYNVSHERDHQLGQ